MASDIFDTRNKKLLSKDSRDLFEKRATQLTSENKGDDVFDKRQRNLIKGKNRFSNELDLLDAYMLQKTQEDLSLKQKQFEKSQRGLTGSFARGLSGGLTGIALGAQTAPIEDESWYERIARLGGELVSDLPAIATGAEVGALAGSAIPGLGTLAGGAAGAFALPSLLKKTYQEYQDYVNQGNDLTFGDFIKRAGRVAKETGKSAILGTAVGKAHKLLPFLESVPGMSKLLNTRIGKPIVETGAELGALTGAQAALEGELPSSQEIFDNAAVLLGAKAGRAVGSKLKIGERIEKVSKPIRKAVAPYLEKVTDSVNKILPESIKNTAKDISAGIKGFKRTANEQRYFEMLEDHVGKRDARVVRSQFKWNRELAKLESKGKVPKKILEEMMYYRQKTGNPYIKGDSYKKLSERLPKEAKNFVDNTVANHFKETLDAWNKNPLTRDINPREALEDIYLPGLYKYDPKKFARAYDEISRQFKTKNPFSNEKKFLSYLEAYKERGLEPRYKNIVDLMRAYDRTIIKIMGNNELLDKVKKYEKKNNLDLIVNPTQEKTYNKAKANGYIPFDDVFLRRYVSGTKDGKLEHATSGRPALVHPEFANAFQGVFKKDAFKPESKFWDYYDSLNNTIRFGRVALSPFHYVALTESALGARGPRALRFKEWINEGKKLASNEEFMVDAADSGLKSTRIDPLSIEKGQKLLDRAVDKLETKGYEKSAKGLNRAFGYLFDEFHPYLKLTTWNEITNNYIEKLTKQGNPPNAKEIKRIKRDVAKHVNNIYGGQRWETMKWFNDPQNMKTMRRLIGYPDWTVSAARQAAEAFSPGLKGELSRKYWLKYGVSMFLLRNLMAGLYGGLTKKEGEKIKWDQGKAYKTLTESDPSKWYQFPLPDVEFSILGKKYNPGRDEKNRKLYSHFGKQALEILGYFKHPTKTLFSKSSPLIQIAGRQILGGSPADRGIFPAQYKYKRGKMEPWGGSEPGSLKEYMYRAKDIAESVIPFGIRTASDRGVAPFLAAGAGAVPISKGMSLYAAEPYIKKALQKKDGKQLNLIKKTLKDNGYSDRQIKSRISLVKREIKTNK